MTPDGLKLWGGLAGVALLALTYHPAVASSLESLKQKITNRLPTPSVPKPVLIEPTPKVTPYKPPCIENPTEVHQAATALMVYFSKQQDTTGVQLAAAVGQHMYDQSAKWMTQPTQAKTSLKPEIEPEKKNPQAL
jgi:hypothetical protein